MLTYVQSVLESSLNILNEASVWLIASFVVAVLLHNVLSPERLQRALGNTRLVSLLKATVSGMLLPICSCGVIPLGLGLYYSGAYLGPTLAFMAATPIINPAAVLLAYGLLGPQLGTIYLAAGLVIPVAVGLVGNMLGGAELYSPEFGIRRVNPVPRDVPGYRQKLVAGLEWGLTVLGPQVSKYVVLGIVLAGIIIASVPPWVIQRYLGNPGLISIGGVAVLGAIMYVCAVGHIPFIAALVASGAAPGVAVTFLVAGVATNLPELLSIYKLIGRRTAIIYSTTLVVSSLLIGYLTNQLLLPGFTPYFDLSRGQHAVDWASRLIVSTPEPIRYLCSLVVFGLCLYAYWPKVRPWLVRSETTA